MDGDNCEPPVDFPAPEGDYILRIRNTYPDVNLTREESVDLRPTRSGISVSVVKETESEYDGERETTFVLVNFRRKLYFYKNHRDLMETLHYGKDHSPTAHAINQMTRSSDNIQAIIGFSNGALALRELFSKATRWFRQGGMDNTNSDHSSGTVAKDCQVTVACWVPGSESRFLVARSDGSLLVYDTERRLAQEIKCSTLKENVSLNVARNRSEYNPEAAWTFNNQKKAITAMSFSPDCHHLAIVGKDGKLRVVHFNNEKEVFTRPSYFGGLFCVSWSADGQFLLTGGQDDLVSVWSFKDQDVVARCMGHHSWVSACAFDPYRSDHGTYRFGSVGQDTRLLLWDFSATTLRSQSVSSTALLSPKSQKKKSKKKKHADKDQADSENIPRNRAEVPMLEPLVNVKVHYEPVTDLMFTQDMIVTVCQGCEIKVWQRPHLVTATAV